MILMFREIVLINRTRSIKIKKTPHTVMETIIPQIILKLKLRLKIGINPEELQLLEYALIMTFFTESR